MKKRIIRLLVLLVILAGAAVLIINDTYGKRFVVKEVRTYLVQNQKGDFYDLYGSYGGVFPAMRYTSRTPRQWSKEIKISRIDLIKDADGKVITETNGQGFVTLPLGVRIEGTYLNTRVWANIQPGDSLTAVSRKAEDVIYIVYDTENFAVQ